MLARMLCSAVVGASAVVMLGSGAGASEPSGPPPFTWDGFYAGIQIGRAQSGGSKSVDVDGYSLEPGGSFTLGGDEGFFGGVQLGYNRQLGRWVLGVEGEFGSVGLSQSRQDPARISAPGDHIATVDYNWFGTVTGRVGFAFDRALVYGKAGWGWVDTDVSFTDTFGVTQLASGTQTSKTLGGAVYGGGIELPLSDALSFKVEYLHFNIDDMVRVTATDNFGDRWRFDHHIDGVDTVKLGFNVKLP